MARMSHKKKKQLARKLLSRVERKRVSLAPLLQGMRGMFVSHLFSSAKWEERKKNRMSRGLDKTLVKE